jgi:hypothetical protein
MHREAVTAAGAELVRFARSCGLIRGEWIAIDGSKFRAVASIDSARERLALQRYLDSIEKADEEQQTSIDPSAVEAALEKLKRHPEPEAGFMLMRQNTLPAYNVQTAVDTQHARSLQNSSKQAVTKRLTICLTDRLIDHGWKSNEFRNSACMRISDDEMRVFKRACLPKRSSKHAQRCGCHQH